MHHMVGRSLIPTVCCCCCCCNFDLLVGFEMLSISTGTVVIFVNVPNEVQLSSIQSHSHTDTTTSTYTMNFHFVRTIDRSVFNSFIKLLRWAHYLKSAYYVFFLFFFFDFLSVLFDRRQCREWVKSSRQFRKMEKSKSFHHFHETQLHRFVFLDFLFIIVKRKIHCSN